MLTFFVLPLLMATHNLIGVRLCCIYYPLANVSFGRPVYGVNEDNGPAQPVLVLSNPLSTDILVQVNATDGSATGQYFNNINNTLNLVIFIG